MLDQGLWSTSGKTPQQTVAAALYGDIRRRGTASAFERTDRNTFGLRENRESAGAQPGQGGQAASADGEAPKRLSFTDAAGDILRAAGEPLHYREITERALNQDLVRTRGRTPEASLRAQISTEISRAEKRGREPRFTVPRRGFIGLTEWVERGIRHDIDRHNEEAEATLLAELRDLSPDAFEQLIGELLRGIGIKDVEVTAYHGDHGIDARGVHEVASDLHVTIAVQAKRQATNIQRPVVQALNGSLTPREQGLIVTTSGFSAGARDEAQRQDKPLVWLVDGPELVRLLVDNDIGVRRIPIELIEAVGFELDTDDGEAGS